MSHDASVDELFRLPLDEFVKARNDLAKRVRSQDREAAKAVKALPKPSVSAWAVNQLYWHRREVFERLLAAGDQLRSAQQAALSGQGSPALLAEASAARRQAVEALLEAAEGLLVEAGHGTSPATLRRVAQSLEALTALGVEWPEPGPGRLTADLEPPGFDALALLAASLPKAPAVESDTAATTEPEVTHSADAPTQPEPAAVDDEPGVPLAAVDGGSADSHEAARAALAAARQREIEAGEAAERAGDELNATLDAVERAEATVDRWRRDSVAAGAAQQQAVEAQQVARAQADELERALKRARDEVRRTEERATQLAEETRRAGRELDETQRALAQATERRDQAERAVGSTQAALLRAQRATAAAEARLDGLSRGVKESKS